MEIIGHQKQWNFLKRAIQSGRLSHAYLFAGQEGLGKKTLALKLASILLDSNQKLNSHPDFIFIEAELKESKLSSRLVTKVQEGKEIQILQIRELIRKISFKPSLAQKKVVIIDNAHLMNKEAQTSFLKTLEEPKGSCFLILISDKPGYLFPTILSRLQTVKFNFVEKEEIEKHLLKYDLSKEEVKEISEIALGRPGKALNLAFDKKKLEDFKQKMKELDKISNSSLFFRFQYVKKIAEDLKETKEVLDIWLYCYRKNFLKNPTKKIRKIINLIETTKFLILNTNINLKLALERLVLEI